MALTQSGFISVSTPLEKDKLVLQSFRGQERISGLFQYSLQMISEDPNVDFSKIVGKSATITVTLTDGTSRYINGIVGRFILTGADDNFATYYMELYPWFWLLSLTSDCRIWQNKSVIDIVTGLFDQLGFSGQYKNSTTGTYTALEYCVQYNESVFSFVSRLLESSGIFYYFTYEDGKHTLVLGDDSTAFTDCPGAATVNFGVADNYAQQNTVTSCSIEEVVIPGKFAVDDFGFETPSTDLLGTATSKNGGANSSLRVYEYPAGYVKKDAGQTLADLRMAEQETGQKVMHGTSICSAFYAGAKTTLAKFGRDDANAAYVLTRIEHEGNTQSYANSFDAVPATAPFRPIRTAPRPIIPGTQTAIVVGKSGEEIWTDPYGRVKVQFHWDQKGTSDENSSCWIRVAQGWAGKSWGQMFLPRVGQEVVVTFLNGDPDRPLITGAVYNAEQTVPYKLPDNATQSTVKSNSSKGGSGFNEIRFEDKKDSEELFMQAQKDMKVTVLNDQTVGVGTAQQSGKGNQTVTVYNDRTVTVEQGNATFDVQKGNNTINVEKGNETYSVGGTRDVTVTGAETHTNKDAFTQKVTKDYTLTIDGNLSINVTGSVTIKSKSDMTLQSTAGINVKATGDLALAGSDINSEAQLDMQNKALNITNKATMNLNSEGTMVDLKASGMNTVEASGMLTLKGAMVKIN